MTVDDDANSNITVSRGLKYNSTQGSRCARCVLLDNCFEASQDETFARLSAVIHKYSLGHVLCIEKGLE